MKIIYLASYKALLKYDDIFYQDKLVDRDVGGCMLDVDLSSYDIIIATPPCNFYSQANYRRETNYYAQATKNLLPAILIKLGKQNKPFIVENVINKVVMKKAGIFIICDMLNIVYKEVGRHSYFTNVKIDLNIVEQIKDDVQNTTNNNRQGGKNVSRVLNYWLGTVIIRDIDKSEKEGRKYGTKYRSNRCNFQRSTIR